MTKKNLLLVELNEVNFDLAAPYAERNGLTNLAKVIKQATGTASEQVYEKLEPWVQWVSVHTGKTAEQHDIFRLGDIVGSKQPQFFEDVERRGFSVGAISPMNAENRLSNPAYFVPDPWTKTPADSSMWSRALGNAVSQAVNDNAHGKMSLLSLFSLAAGLLRFAKIRHYPLYVRLALGSLKHGFRKALFLDLLLHDVHLTLFQNRKTDFSTLFLNAGAHIQHHYFLNARQSVKTELKNPGWYAPADLDPFGEVLALYDVILGDYLDMPGIDLIVATGLTQVPYDRVKFYYRLKDHPAFLKDLGIAYKAVHPRMTRDFLIEFGNAQEALAAQAKLAGFTTADGTQVFGDIDNRGDSLFVTLTYPHEIGTGFMISDGSQQLDLHPHVAFVAINNGMHASHGFAYYRGGIEKYAPPDGSHVKEIHGAVMRYFEAA
jgi:hypothetical protein